MSIEQWLPQINAYFDAHQEEVFSLLETLVNMDSFSHDARDVNAVGELSRQWMADAGFDAKMLPHPEIPADEQWMHGLGNVFMARTHPREAGPGIIFLGHIDTVYPAGTAARTPFRVEGGRAYGPGVADMKAGVVANMFVARALRELGLIDVPMTVVFSPDEELGGPTAGRVYRTELRGGTAVLCTEPGFIGGGVTVQRKGSGHFLVEIDGISAHAGRDYEKGASANLELAHKMLGFDKLLDLPAGTTVNTGLIEGGSSANSVSPWARARVHTTFQTLEAGEKVVRGIRDVAATTFVPGTKTRISGGIRLYPLTPSEEGTRLLHLVQRAGDALGTPVHPQQTKGASEAGYTSTVLGIPSICSLGAEGANIHAEGEYIETASLLPRCKLVALSALLAAQEFRPVSAC